MSVLSELMEEGVRPALMEALGDPDALRYSPPNREPFTVDAILGKQRAVQQYSDQGDLVKVLTATVQIQTSDLVRQGVTGLELMAKVDAYGVDGWSIRLETSVWGPGLVTLGLERRLIAHHNPMEARRT